MVFDDDFSTVPSISYDSEPPSFWNKIDLDQNILRVPLDSDSTTCLGKDWLTPSKLEERTHSNIRQGKPHTLFQPDSIAQEDPSEVTSNYSEDSLDTPPLG